MASRFSFWIIGTLYAYSKEFSHVHCDHSTLRSRVKDLDIRLDRVGTVYELARFSALARATRAIKSNKKEQKQTDRRPRSSK